MAAMQDSIIGHFGDMPVDVMSEATSICRSFSLSPEELWYKWESYVHSYIQAAKSASSTRTVAAPEFTIDHARELRRDIQTTYRPIKPKMEMDSTPSAKHAMPRKSVGKSGLNNILDGLQTPQVKKKAMLGSNTPATASKATPRASNFGQINYTDDFSTPAKAEFATPGPSRITQQNINTILPATAGFVKSSWQPPKPSTFESRTVSDRPIESLNAHLDTSVGIASVNSKVSLMSNADPKAYHYRYMFEKLTDRSEAHDVRIDECAEIIRQAYEIEEEFGDPSHDSQEDSVCVGRVCTDLHSSKLYDMTDRSKTSIWLESSRLMGGGARVELRFDDNVVVHGAEANDGGAGLFPGGIVGVKGRNVGGAYFQVAEIYMMPPLIPPESSPRLLMDLQHGDAKLSGRPLSVTAVCGPYTTDDNLDFAPLAAFIEVCKKNKPDVVILMGPFIDVNHPAIKWGAVDQSPTQLFREHFSSRLAGLFQSSPATTAILIPSLRDILSNHVAFPQGPLQKDPELGLPKRAKFLPNPAVFTINEVHFAVTSVDVLFPLRQLEYLHESGATPSSDGMDLDSTRDNVGRICRHVLRQRTIYPLFPAPTGPGLDPVNLDVTHMDLLKLNSVGLDVLIIPSRLGNSFAKVIDSAIVVNPARLTQGSSGGTFAHFTVHPMAKSDLQQEIARENMSEEEHVIDHKVWERGRIDILKI